MTRSTLQRVAAFTLIEAMAVVIVIGILAVSAVPAVGLISGMNRAGASAEVVRQLELARARAMSAGRPHGVRFSVTDQTMRPMWIATSGAVPTPARTQLNEDAAIVGFDSFGAVELESYIGGDGISTEGTVWFASDGTPQARSAAGSLLGDCAADASIKVKGQTTVTVRRITGIVQ